MPSVTDPVLLNLEKQIGIPAQTGTAIPAEQIAPERQPIISYLIIKGLPKSNCDKCSNEVLGKLYGIPKYLESAILNERTGKNKYKNPRIQNIDIDTNISEDDACKEIVKSLDIEEPKNLPSQYQISDSDIEIPGIEKTKKYLESLVRDTIFRAIKKETNYQKEVIEAQNRKFQDAILTTIHNDVNIVLTKALESNREIASDIAKEITENKIKHENNNLKTLVEDIIFQSYRGHLANNQITSPQISENPSNQTPISQNPFLPKIDPNYHFDPYAVKVIRSALHMSENLYVYGDTGCGKTTHLEQVCAVLGRGLIRINPHDGITREMFLGSMKLINNETIFVEGALPRAMREGLVFLVDEISFLPPNLTAILNPIGERNGKLYISETSEWISPSPGFCIFATDNTGGKGDRTGNYTGTEVQNTATLDRFAFCLKMDYLPEEKEMEMLSKRFPNQNISEIEKIQHLALEIRSAFSRGELSITLSTRKLIKFFDQRENDFTISEALNNTILSWLDEDDETLVKTMIDRLDILNLTNPPDTIINQNQSREVQLKDFMRAIGNDRIVAAIKELKDQNNNLSLSDAKKIAERYRDGLITIQEVQEKMLRGSF